MTDTPEMISMQRFTDLQEEHVKCCETWDRQRAQLNAEIEKFRTNRDEILHSARVVDDLRFKRIEELKAALARTESSRRDWAAEAMRLEMELERRADLLHSIWLYVDWRKVTRQLTTEQKDMWADAVEAFSEILEPGDPVEADRWWRDPGFSRPVCAVHGEET